MAELILTDEEKRAALWSDLDDAALGQLVKKKMAFLTDASAQMDRAVTTSAALLLACIAAERGAGLRIDLEGVTQAGASWGDWIVQVQRRDAFVKSLLTVPVMTSARPAAPGWYWYALPGSWELQPARVFEFEGELWYTLEAIGRNGPDEGLRLAECDDQTRWSTEPIAMPSEAPFRDFVEPSLGTSR